MLDPGLESLSPETSTKPGDGHLRPKTFFPSRSEHQRSWSAGWGTSLKTPSWVSHCGGSTMAWVSVRRALSCRPIIPGHRVAESSMCYRLLPTCSAQIHSCMCLHVRIHHQLASRGACDFGFKPGIAAWIKCCFTSLQVSTVRELSPFGPSCFNAQ